MHLIVSHLIPFNINSSLLSYGAPGTMRIFVFFLPCNRESEWMLGCVIKRRRPTTFRAVWASLDCETQFNGIKTELSKEFGLLASCLFWHRSLSHPAHRRQFRGNELRFQTFDHQILWLPHMKITFFSHSLGHCRYFLQLLGHRKTSRCCFVSNCFGIGVERGTNKKSILITSFNFQQWHKIAPKERELHSNFKWNRNRLRNCQLSNFTHFSYWLNPKRVQAIVLSAEIRPSQHAMLCCLLRRKKIYKIFKLNK